MQGRNLITKIALGVAIAALLFSIVTLIRAIVLGAGVLIAAVQVIGTAIIVAICAIMLYVIGAYEEDEEEPQDLPEEEEPAEDAADDEETAWADEKYDFKMFE